jgi:hypothetical protein
MRGVQDIRIKIYEEIHQSHEKVNKLEDEKERQIVLIALQSLHQKNSASKVNESDLQTILLKLGSPVVEEAAPSKTPWYQRLRKMIKALGKGILNLLHLRTSPNQILHEVDQITAEKNELEQIPKSINKKKEELIEWQEYLIFQEASLPHYQDIKAFYENLPDDVEQALPLLQEKIQEIEPKAEAAVAEFKRVYEQRYGREPQKEEIKGGLIQVLRNEILSSLTKMANYKTSAKKRLVREYENLLVKPYIEALKRERNDSKIKNDIHLLPADIQAEILEQVKKKEEEAQVESEEVRKEIQKGFTTELNLTRIAWQTALAKVSDPEAVQLALRNIPKLQREIAQLQIRENELRGRLDEQLYKA